jgi:sec-independent protein translocase protein TatC
MAQAKEMSFFDHLEELRWRIIRSFSAIFIFSLAAFSMKDFVFSYILFGPTKVDFPTYRFLCAMVEKYNLAEAICVKSITYQIVNLELAGQFMVHIKTSLAIGLVFAFPYLIWELWLFIKPGLYEAEVRASRSAILSSAFLFFVGVLFGYYILTPFSVNFFAGYNVSETVQNTFSLTNYINFVTMFVLLSGLMFQLPVVIFFLAKIGLVSASLMREYRKHSLIGIMIISAIITPADIGTMIIVAVPLYILYELSIFIAQATYKPEID